MSDEQEKKGTIDDGLAIVIHHFANHRDDVPTLDKCRLAPDLEKKLRRSIARLAASMDGLPAYAAMLLAESWVMATGYDPLDWEGKQARELLEAMKSQELSPEERVDRTTRSSFGRGRAYHAAESKDAAS